MLLLLLIYVVLRALWKIDVYLISTLVNKSPYYCYYYYYRTIEQMCSVAHSITLSLQKK